MLNSTSTYDASCQIQLLSEYSDELAVWIPLNHTLSHTPRTQNRKTTVRAVSFPVYSSLHVRGHFHFRINVMLWTVDRYCCKIYMLREEKLFGNKCQNTTLLTFLMNTKKVTVLSLYYLLLFENSSPPPPLFQHVSSPAEAEGLRAAANLYRDWKMKTQGQV